VLRNCEVDANSVRVLTLTPIFRSAAVYMAAWPFSSSQLRVSSFSMASVSKALARPAAAARNLVFASEN